CPMLGKACYLLPGALLYGTAVLLHILPVPAPFSQMLSFLFFIPAAATFLALWYEGSPTPVADAGGWVCGFLAFPFAPGLEPAGRLRCVVPSAAGLIHGGHAFLLAMGRRGNR